MRELAGTELGEIDAVGGTQATDLPLVIRALRRVVAPLVDETVPDVDVDDSGLLGPAAVELVEVRGVRAGLAVALRRQTDPQHRDAGAFERCDHRVDAPDVGELPLLRVKLPGSVGGLARLLGRHVHVFGGFSRRGRLLLRVRRRGRDRRRRGGSGLARLCIRLRRAWARRRRCFFADRLTVVVSEHHDDEFRFLGRDDLARHLRPFEVAALVIADQTGIGAVLAHDGDLRVFREGVLEPIGQPIRIGVAHDDDRGRRLGLLL